MDVAPHSREEKPKLCFNYCTKQRWRLICIAGLSVSLFAGSVWYVWILHGMVKDDKVKFRWPGKAVPASDLQVLGSNSVGLKRQADWIRQSVPSPCGEQYLGACQVPIVNSNLSQSSRCQNFFSVGCQELCLMNESEHQCMGTFLPSALRHSASPSIVRWAECVCKGFFLHVKCG